MPQVPGRVKCNHDLTGQLDAALRVAARGWRVFPCGRDKKPLTPNGFKAATTDPEQIRAWWSRWPDASIGCPTGPEMGKAGAWVLDVDLPDGPATLSALESEHGALPATVEQRTGGGGRQLFFRWPEGRDVPSRVGKIGKNLDIRGRGGYVILPPSGHPSGGRYAWTSNGVPLAEAPEWLLDLVAPLPKPGAPRPEPMKMPARGCGYGRAALEREAARVAVAAQGTRNATLNEAAFAIGQLVAGGEVDRGEAESMLLAAAQSCGLPEGEARKTIQSGMAAGMQEPRSAPEKPRKAEGTGGEGRASLFVERKDGVYFLVEDKDGDITPEWVCSPLRVLALTRNADNVDWGRLIEVVDPDGVVKTWAMPMAMTAGSGEEYRAVLNGLGLTIAPGHKGRDRLDLFLKTFWPEARARCVSRVGWHGPCFVLSDAVFGPTQGERLLLQREALENPFRTLGTLEDWQREVGAYCVGNSRLVLAVSAALAATLLALAGAESGGLHFVGGSSQGKTTLLHVAGSVCGGGGLNGFIRQWRATSNGLEAVAAAHCDSLLCLDELAQVAAREAGEVAYMLANGTGKTRANKSGGGRKAAEWRVLFLSTGELTLADKVGEDGKGRTTAGQAVRVVDIPADAGAGFGLFERLHGFEDGGQFSRHLKDASGRFYGTPLRAFLEYVANHTEDVRRGVTLAMRGFSARHCPPAADGQVRRVLERFALAAAAGELGAGIRVLPWPKGEAAGAALACFNAWLVERGGAGAAEAQAAIARVRAFIEAHGSSRFEDFDGGENQKIINRVGFRQRAEGQTRYCIFPEAFKREVIPGMNPKTVCAALAEAGFLSHEKRRHTQSVRTTDGKRKFYVVSSAILSGDTGDTGDTGDNAENIEKNLSPLGEGVPGTPGTKFAQEKNLSPLSPLHMNEEGTEKVNNNGAVPTVPTVPTENEVVLQKPWNDDGEVEL
ncbi:MAG: DUF927 domain-containing protein [Thermodesulfobacteriota bacterium]